MTIRLRTRFLTVALCFLVLAFCMNHSGWSQTRPKLQDLTEKKDQFGMRIRTTTDHAAVFAPILIGEAPGNEATIIRLPDGALKIFFINRPGDADKLLSISSSDNGLSWHPPQVAFGLPGQAYYANQVLAGQDGALHCVFHLFGEGTNGYRNRHLDLYYCKTENRQTSWSKPQKIFDGYVGSIRGFVQLASGRLITAFAKAVPARQERPAPGVTDYGWNEIVTLYSDDNGATWLPSDHALKIAIDGSKVTRYGAVEPAIIELKEHRLWMLMRTTEGHLYESFSLNGGKSWQLPQRTRFISSDSPAGLLRLSDERMILFLSSNQRWDDPRSYAMGGREVLHAAISDNEGRSWKGFREVLTAPTTKAAVRGDRGTAYPSAVETTDGKVVLVSGQGEAKAIVLFDPDWLEQSTAGDDFSQGLAQWTLYGADSLTYLVQPSKETGQALHIRKSPAHRASDTEAVWNFPMITKGELIVEVELKRGSKGINLALTDHFSIAGDALASENALVNVSLTGTKHKAFRKAGKRIALKITWDIEEKMAWVFVDGNPISEMEFQRQPSFGINYLRLGIPGTVEDVAGFYLHSVKVSDLSEELRPESAVNAAKVSSQYVKTSSDATVLAHEKELVLQISPGPDNPRNSEGDFITLSNGDLLYVYTHYTGASGADHAHAYLAGRLSNDGGKTWSKKDITIVENEGSMNVMSVSLLRMQTGEIALFYLRKNSATDCAPMMRISRDEGKTWGAPQRCISAQGYHVMNNNRVVQLESGRIIMPVGTHKPAWKGYREFYVVHSWYSDDNGKTWLQSKAVPNPGNVLMQEPGIVELTNGDLFMIMRTDKGVQYQSFSRDRGLTWEPAKPSNIVSPLSPAKITRIPATGDLLLAWNHNGANQKRTPLCLAISRDEGKTWGNIEIVENDPLGSFCYPAIDFAGEHVLLGYWNRADKNNSSTDIARIKLESIYRE